MNKAVINQIVINANKNALKRTPEAWLASEMNALLQHMQVVYLLFLVDGIGAKEFRDEIGRSSNRLKNYSEALIKIKEESI